MTGNSKDGAMLSPEATQIETFTGRFVDLYKPDPTTICIEDVAHHLSVLCRYGGAVKRFYSVAEHCCLVHDLTVAYLPEPSGPSGSRSASPALWCRPALMHDAPEAYLQDVVAPLKYALRVEEASGRAGTEAAVQRILDTGFQGAYGRLTERMEEAIAVALDVDIDRCNEPFVRLIDMWALRCEARELTYSGGKEWRWSSALPNGGELPVHYALFKDRQWGMHPALAEAAFLERWHA